LECFSFDPNDFVGGEVGDAIHLVGGADCDASKIFVADCDGGKGTAIGEEIGADFGEVGERGERSMEVRAVQPERKSSPMEVRAVREERSMVVWARQL
jgi:hypothetical protein